MLHKCEPGPFLEAGKLREEQVEHGFVGLSGQVFDKDGGVRLLARFDTWERPSTASRTPFRRQLRILFLSKNVSHSV